MRRPEYPEEYVKKMLRCGGKYETKENTGGGIGRSAGGAAWPGGIRQQRKGREQES